MLIQDSSVNTIYNKMLSMGGYSPRKGQVDMMNASSNVFRHGGVALCEAGTGTGKSFAYGLPGAIIGKEKNKSLIISTSNVSLQTQLVQKDIPVIEKVMGSPVTSVVAKGKSRFLCWAKVEKNQSNPDCNTIMNMKRDGESMDMDSIPESVNAKNLISVRVTHQCKGRACHHYNSCEYQTNKNKVKTADIIVTNHSYLLTDLSIGGGILLPKMSDCLVAIDEAHNLPNIAINAFSEKHWLSQSISELGNVGLFEVGGEYKREIELINKSILTLNTNLDSISMLLENSENLKKSGMIVYKDGVIPEGLFARRERIAEQSKILNDRMQFLSQTLDDEMTDDDDPFIAKLHATIYRGMMENLKVQKVWNLFGENIDGEPPVAKWFKNIKHYEDIEVGASVTSASKRLKETLIDSGAAVVIASATMCDQSGFENFKRECGITNAISEVRCMSPFNYRENANLVVPAMRFDPTDVEGHTGEVISISGKVMKKGQGGLVLFSSKQQMLQVRDGMKDGFEGEILVQGELSKKKLIEKHCQNVDAGITSVIFGLDSFYEGIDLKGEYCSTVVISKLPFPTMDDPVFIVKKHQIEKNGGNSFTDLILPYVIKKLTQGVGRLIRTMEDFGDVFILDSRIATKRYGVQMLNQLPDMNKKILVEV